jgi:peroxiredoxin
MDPNRDLLCHTTRFPLRYATALAIMFYSSSARADRPDDFKKLELDYAAALQKFSDAHKKERPTDEDFIKNWDDYPFWDFAPRFIALAEAKPGDDTAYQCCLWYFNTLNGLATDDRAIFESEQKAWRIIAFQHSTGDDVPKLCFEAAQTPSPAREEFLRALLTQPNLSPQHAGYATLALAELLSRKAEYAERSQHRLESPPQTSNLSKHIQSRVDPAFSKYLSSSTITDTKNESAKLFRSILIHYADVPNTVSAPHFREVAKLGDKASKSLHALEHLSIGAEAPDIVGQDLNGQPQNLKDYRGRVVVLSFWFTGCGPCMQLVPEEQRLVETFKDRPFALLGITSDADAELARKTASEHGITWPVWFDGENGPIHRDYNIMSWPTLFLLDQSGHIVDMDVDTRHVEEKITELLDKGRTAKSAGEAESKK